jgi:hypothetical protein
MIELGFNYIYITCYPVINWISKSLYPVTTTSLGGYPVVVISGNVINHCWWLLTARGY